MHASPRTRVLVICNLHEEPKCVGHGGIDPDSVLGGLQSYDLMRASACAKPGPAGEAGRTPVVGVSVPEDRSRYP